MKLATYKDGSRDGQLVVVSRDLTTAHYATGIASRLQLNAGRTRHGFAFDAQRYWCAKRAAPRCRPASTPIR